MPINHWFLRQKESSSLVGLYKSTAAYRIHRIKSASKLSACPPRTFIDTHIAIFAPYERAPSRMLLTDWVKHLTARPTPSRSPLPPRCQ
ncbi:unnamed protein product [Rhizoctonia solani]|uniref:Uncharacterized protein n=1 Tax=Rhizoctonia solani TaxID=456999 RepID=A0A8H3AHQ3_9AGAM|nr:unnamed protein product [Rhizoctonia solani]